MDASKKEILTKKVQLEVVNVLAMQVFQHTLYPTPDEYTYVCSELLDKHEVLQDKLEMAMRVHH